MTTISPGKPMPRRQIDSMEGEDFTITAAVTVGTSIFPACIRHEVTIEKPGFLKALILHGQGEPPVAGMEAKRKRVPEGFAIIWADAAGKVIGGGFTTGAVPRDWRVPPKPKAVIKAGPGTVNRPDGSVLGTFDAATLEYQPGDGAAL